MWLVGLKNMLAGARSQLSMCAGVRRWGSAALDLAYVAAGRYDGYWERGLNIWDIAGGVLLVQESGGFVETIREGQSMLEDGHLIAANADIFPAFAKTIRERS